MEIKKLELNGEYRIYDRDYLGFIIVNDIIEVGKNIILRKGDFEFNHDIERITKRAKTYLVSNSNITIIIKKR